MRWPNMPPCPDDPNARSSQPGLGRLDAQLRQAWARVDRLQSEYGLEALNNWNRSIAHARVQDRLRQAG